MCHVVTGLVFICCSLHGAELKTVRFLVASDNDTTSEVADEEARAVADALIAAAPEGMLEGFHYEDGILTVFGNSLRKRKPGQEIFRATHVSDCPSNSVFEFETVVSMLILRRIILKIAEAWSRVRHPELKGWLLQEVTIDGKRVEVLLQREPEVVTPGQ